MVNILRKLLDYIDSAMKYIFYVLLATMLGVAFLQVIARSVLSISVSWTDELTRYLFIWLIFIGIAFSIRRAGHISIDTIYLFIKEDKKETYRKFLYILQIVFFAAVFFFSFNFMVSNFTNTSPAMQLPMGYVYMSLPIGCILSILFLLEKIFIDREGVPE